MRQRVRRAAAARAALARLVREPAVRRYDSAGHAEPLDPATPPARALVEAAEEMLRAVAESRAKAVRERAERDAG